MSNNEDHERYGHLAELRKNGDGFRTPDPAYFEALAERSIQAGQQSARTVGINRKWLSLAASFVLLLIATFIFWPGATNKGQLAEFETVPASEELLADIDASDIEAYIADNLDNFETELYANETSNFDSND